MINYSWLEKKERNWRNLVFVSSVQRVRCKLIGRRRSILASRVISENIELNELQRRLATLSFSFQGQCRRGRGEKKGRKLGRDFSSWSRFGADRGRKADDLFHFRNCFSEEQLLREWYFLIFAGKPGEKEEIQEEGVVEIAKCSFSFGLSVWKYVGERERWFYIFLLNILHTMV